MTFISTQIARVRRMPRELFLFGIAVFAIGIGSNIFESTFNNFLDERFMITPFPHKTVERAAAGEKA